MNELIFGALSFTSIFTVHTTVFLYYSADENESCQKHIKVEKKNRNQDQSFKGHRRRSQRVSIIVVAKFPVGYSVTYERNCTKKRYF